jgi:hypothetical protein
MPDPTPTTDSLLADLNDWETRYGAGRQGEADYKVPGEARARIDYLKEELARRGVHVRWDGACYVADP